MLRVIAGEHRGRKLKQPSGNNIRPTMDRTKEGMFSMIQFKIPGAIVLDLFSGTGSLAIEAISRGAMKAISVDNSKEAFKIMNENKELLRLNNYDIKNSNVVSYVKSMKGVKFNLIFMDPPYNELDLYNQTLEMLSSSELLTEQGLIIVETDNPNIVKIPKGFVIQKTKKYGKTHIMLIANNI